MLARRGLLILLCAHKKVFLVFISYYCYYYFLRSSFFLFIERRYSIVFFKYVSIPLNNNSLHLTRFLRAIRIYILYVCILLALQYTYNNPQQVTLDPRARIRKKYMFMLILFVDKDSFVRSLHWHREEPIYLQVYHVQVL